jgi:UDP-N-acetylmuramyl pentapeptide phosphotransferase/UDP-N-acetylglucosamine-1-phosphate transferase
MVTAAVRPTFHTPEERRLRTTLTILAAFALSALLTFLFIRWVNGGRIVAVENHRSMHKGSVAVGGGWPLLTAAMTAFLLIWPLDATRSILVPAAVALALVSWADDRKALSPAWRLAAHLAASAAAVMALPGDALVLQGYLPFALDRLVAAMALAWFINLYNFMDGIDGIAGAETVAIAFGYAAITYASASDSAPLYGLALALGASALGFLLWNWSPARIFLGDVGSVPIGFLTGAMMLDLAVRHSLVAALLLPLYFAADATITLLRRIVRGERPWEAHRSHYYQRAALGLGSHAAVVMRVVTCNGALMIAAVLAITAPALAATLGVAAVAALLVNLERAARRRPAAARSCP